MARSALRKVVDGLSLALTRDLKVQVELNVAEAPIVSIPATAPAYLEAGTLHVRGEAMTQGAWIAAFRQIFLSIEHHCPQTDIKPLATTAALVTMSGSREEAESALKAAEFSPPPASGWEEAKATALDDLETVSETAETPEEPENENGNEAQKGDLLENSVDRWPQNQKVEVGLNINNPGSPTSTRVDDQSIGNLASDQPVGAPSNKVTAPFSPGAGIVVNNLPQFTGAKRAEMAVPADDDYKSKSGGKPFGGESDKNAATISGSNSEGAGAAATAGRHGKPKSARMLAYVARSGDRSDADRDDLSDERNKEIDARAIERAMRYESDQGRSPIEQDHFNPGFDIVSTEPSGKRRLIEVKGLRGPWNERGTKLTRTQFSMAQTHAGEFWLYIVELALDPNAQQLYGIRNPFQKVDEFWFDSAWKGAAERLADPVQLNARVGAIVHHEHWGSGRVLEIKKAGLQTRATVDFGMEGKKFVPFNILKFVD